MVQGKELFLKEKQNSLANTFFFLWRKIGTLSLGLVEITNRHLYFLLLFLRVKAPEIPEDLTYTLSLLS